MHRVFQIAALGFSFLTLSAAIASAQNAKPSSAPNPLDQISPQPSGENSTAPSKPIETSREPYVYETVRGFMRYENDGTGSLEIKARIKVQSATGVERIGQLVFDFNSANERLDVVSVRVVKPDGKIVVTGSDSVQDLSAPVALRAPMYSDARQKHVTVSDLSAGDTLEYDVLTTTFKPLTPGQFWQSWKFINDAPSLDEQVELSIPKGRALKMKSPPDVTPTSRTEGDRQLYFWKTTTDHAADVVIPGFDAGNSFNPTILLQGPKPAPYRQASFTTFENWSQVGLWYSELERDRRVPTAELKTQADEITKDAKTDIEKAQALYQYVTRNIRYVSLSFGVGRYQPHFAAEVLTNKYGDCKDKATLLDALLEAEGIHSSTALINSKFEIDPDVPVPSQFDHAISFVSVGGKDIWLDSTAQVAPFEYLLPQLRGKDALVVLSPRQAELRETPKNLPFPKYYRLDVDGTVTEKKIDVQIGFESRGDAEVLARAAMLALPPAKLAQLMTAGAKQSHPDGDAAFTDLKAGDPFDTTNPYRIEVHVSGTRTKSSNAASTSSSALFSDSDVKSFLKPVLPEMALPHEELVLSGPEQFVLKIKLTAPEGKNLPTFQPAHIVNDFAEFDAQGSSDGHVLSVETTLNIKASEIPASRMTEYGEFRNDVVAKLVHFMKAANPPATDSTTVKTRELTHQVPESPTDEEEAAQFYASGMKAFKERDYQEAVELLKLSAARNPHDGAVLNQLGRSYMNLNQVSQAIPEFRKAIEADPDSGSAYNNLGFALTRERKYDEAIPLFRKQIEINPGALSARQNLGQLYLQTKEYDKAATELELVAQKAPNNEVVATYLGTAYAMSHQPEKAMKAFEHALELSPRAPTRNDVAYGMAQANMNLDRAESLVRSAISEVGGKTNTIDLTALSDSDASRMCELAEYWDTLGWVKFQAGDLRQAEKYVGAAWSLCELTDIGDHLGQIYEKDGRKAAAIIQYEAALGKQWPAPETRARLAALLPSGANLDAAISASNTTRSADTAIRFENSGHVQGSEGVWLLLKPGPTVNDVRFLVGNDDLASTASSIRAVSFPDMFPDRTEVTLLRRASVMCSNQSSECRISLTPADSVLSVK